MSKHDVEVTYDRDADNRTIRAGALWRETRPGFEQLVVVAGTASFFAVVAGVLWLMATRQMTPLPGYGLVGLVAAAGLLFGLPGDRRAVYFQADGRMQTPFGIYYRPGLPAIGGHLDNVVSIEARMQREQSENWEKMFEVIMVSSGGDLIVVSRNLHEATALKVAAQLTHAINNVRRDRGGYEGAWAEVA